MIRKPVAFIALSSFLLSSCVTFSNQASNTGVGPFLSSIFEANTKSDGRPKPKLDVIIPVFNPGLSADPDDLEKAGIWPELRRAEANRFALKLKFALEETGAFGAVRVAPDKNATGDLYILGTIDESNGEEVEIDLQVVDISGRIWMSEDYIHTVKVGFYQNLRNEGKDPYDPLFTAAALDVAEELEDHTAKELIDLQYLTDLRFGASFSEDKFENYLKFKNGRVTMIAKPSDNDLMLLRIKAIRVRDQLFLDNFQPHYKSFSNQMNESYLIWQQQSLLLVNAEREAKKGSITDFISGTIFVGTALVFSVIKASPKMGLAAIVSGLVGLGLIDDGIQASKEAAEHSDAINELGESLDVELAPQVIEFEKKTVTLEGNSREQFNKWRKFLKQIYLAEKAPKIQL